MSFSTTFVVLLDPCFDINQINQSIKMSEGTFMFLKKLVLEI